MQKLSLILITMGLVISLGCTKDEQNKTQAEIAQAQQDSLSAEEYYGPQLVGAPSNGQVVDAKAFSKLNAIPYVVCRGKDRESTDNRNEAKGIVICHYDSADNKVRTTYCVGPNGLWNHLPHGKDRFGVCPR